MWICVYLCVCYEGGGEGGVEWGVAIPPQEWGRTGEWWLARAASVAPHLTPVHSP